MAARYSQARRISAGRSRRYRITPAPTPVTTTAHESAVQNRKYQPGVSGDVCQPRGGACVLPRLLAWQHMQHRHSSLARPCRPQTSITAGAGDPAAAPSPLDAAYAAHPERFVHDNPKVRRLPSRHVHQIDHSRQRVRHRCCWRNLTIAKITNACGGDR